MPNSGLGPGYVVRGFSRLMHVIGSMPGMKSRVGVGNLEAIRRTGTRRAGSDWAPIMSLSRRRGPTEHSCLSTSHTTHSRRRLNGSIITRAACEADLEVGEPWSRAPGTRKSRL